MRQHIGWEIETVQAVWDVDVVDGWVVVDEVCRIDDLG